MFDSRVKYFIEFFYRWWSPLRMWKGLIDWKAPINYDVRIKIQPINSYNALHFD